MIRSKTSALAFALLLVAAPAVAEPVPKGELVVTTKPAGGKVSVDGTAVGVSPATVRRLLPGQHLVEVTWHDGTTASTVLEVTGVSSQRVTIRPGMEMEPTPVTTPATTPTTSTSPSTEPQPDATKDGSTEPRTDAAPTTDPTTPTTDPTTTAPAPGSNRSARLQRTIGMGLTAGGAGLNILSLMVMGGGSITRRGGGIVTAGAVLLVLSLPVIVVGAVLWAINAKKLKRIALAPALPPPSPPPSEIALSSALLGTVVGAGFGLPF